MGTGPSEASRYLVPQLPRLLRSVALAVVVGWLVVVLPRPTSSTIKLLAPLTQSAPLIESGMGTQALNPLVTTGQDEEPRDGNAAGAAPWRWVTEDVSQLDASRFLFGGTVLELQTKIPEDVKVQVEIPAAHMRFAQWQFGDYTSTSVALAIDLSDGRISRVFIDRNRDRVLTSDEGVTPTAQGNLWIAELDAEVHAEAGIVHVPRQIAMTSFRDQTRIRISTLGYAEGVLEISGESFAARRLDMDGSGLPVDFRDQIWIDRNRDSKFDVLSERHVVKPVLEFDDVQYQVLSDRLGQSLQLDDNIEQGQLAFQFELDDSTARLASLEGSLRDENGLVTAIRSENSTITVPTGHYAIENLVIQVVDAAGATWRMTLASGSNQSWFQVRADQARAVKLLDEIRLQATSKHEKQTWDGYQTRIDPSLETANGLVVTNLTCDDRQHTSGWSDSVQAQFHISRVGEQSLAGAEFPQPAQCSSAYG